MAHYLDHYQIAIECEKQNDIEKAILHYRKAIESNPDYVEAYHRLALILFDRKAYQHAIELLKIAIRIKPDFVPVYISLGIFLRDCGNLDQAIEYFLEAIRLDPKNQNAIDNLLNGYHIKAESFYEKEELGNVIRYCKLSLNLNPNHSDSYNNMGLSYLKQGQTDLALSLYKKALELNPANINYQSNFLFGLNYHLSSSPEYVFQAHKHWGELYQYKPICSCHDSLKSKVEKKALNVGYVSPDLYGHSVAYFFAPIISFHDTDLIRPFCYAAVTQPDKVTEGIRQLCSSWRNILGMSPAQLADTIQKDEIDILVDLAGHSSPNLMQMFALKPAPIQVTYLGYPNTTGLNSIDYRLTDNWADPYPDYDSLATEKLIRLPNSFLCYGPPRRAPLPSLPPMLQKRYCTFGSFNMLSKVNSWLISLWSKIMKSVSNSKIILKSKYLNDTDTQNHVFQQFEQNGISKERVKLYGFIPTLVEHLALYHEVDIALDTFPYHGTTTTCEALWMGVPVITLEGNRHVSRVGVSILSCIGLPQLIAKTPEHYIDLAVSLAKHQELLSDLHQSIRQQVASSPLCDGKTFTKQLESVFVYFMKTHGI